MDLTDESKREPSDEKPKRPVTLNYSSSAASSKKQKFTDLLSSPDVNMLKLTTPEIEKFIGSTFNIPSSPTQLCPISISDENQENCGGGYSEVINQFHHLNVESKFENVPRQAMPQVRTVLLPWNQPTEPIDPQNQQRLSFHPAFNAMCYPPPAENDHNHVIPGIPDSTSLPPFSMGKSSDNTTDEAKMKLEKKRLRNRIAASKCRQKKLNKIAQLEAKVKEQEEEIAKLKYFLSICMGKLMNQKI